MSCKRDRKTDTRYDRDKMNEFVAEVKSGKSMYSVAKENNVPLETLRRWVMQPTSKLGSGARTVLTSEEETLVSTALQFLAKCGYPQDRSDVKDMVQSFLNSIDQVRIGCCSLRKGIQPFSQRGNQSCSQKPELKVCHLLSYIFSFTCTLIFLP